MNQEFFIHTLSFITLVLFLFWRMRKTFLLILENKIRDVKKNFETVFYLKKIALTSFEEEKKFQDHLSRHLNEIASVTTAKIQNYKKESENNIQNILESIKEDYKRQTDRLNSQIINEIKEEITHKVVSELIKTMKKEGPSNKLLNQARKAM